MQPAEEQYAEDSLLQQLAGKLTHKYHADRPTLGADINQKREAFLKGGPGQRREVSLVHKPGRVAVTHWGVAVGGDLLYHLVVSRDDQKFRFAYHELPSGWPTKPVGHTTMSHEQIVILADMLMDEFAKLGDYHLLYWNCQHFANCLLDLICDGDHEPLPFKGGDLFLIATAASSTSAPLAIFRASEQRAKRTQLLKTLNEQLDNGGDADKVSSAVLELLGEEGEGALSREV